MSNQVDLSPAAGPVPDLSVNERLARSQIRAFLAASEDVDIQPETVQELLQALLADNPSEDAAEPEFDLEVSDLDVSALYFPPEDSEDNDTAAWSSQQIRGMLHHLKEHGMVSWMNEYVLKRNIPVPRLLLAFGVNLSPPLQNMSPTTLLYFLRVALSRELQLRDKLENFNTVDDAIRLIQNSQRILILTGAGISVSCGIPDFRSRDGLYATLKQRGDYDLDDPQQMFDMNYFRENPAVFYSFASQIYPSNFVPSPCHRFIKLVENKEKLLRNYTQNIDGLQMVAGVERVLECHGSFATASCILCNRKVPGSEIEADIMAQRVPLCPVCNPPAAAKPKSKKKKKSKDGWDSDEEDESDGPTFPPGIMKPDITFFHQKLTDDFDHALVADRGEVDLLLIIGTSLKVSPVADIPCYIPHSVPQILINKTPVQHINPDIVLLGNADDIILHLCSKLGWQLPPPNGQTTASAPPPLQSERKRSAAELHAVEEPRRVGESHIWLFEGAEGGEWLQRIEEQIYSADEEDSPANTGNSPKKQRLE